jgi:hypothetical protein
VAAAHCDRVTATDLNERATRFASFNTALNGIEHLECLTGDAFAPVAGQTFDLIVCNPPFVLAPTRESLYRANDRELDDFCRQLVQTAPRHLNPGGFFQVICEWAEVRGTDWRERIADWCAGTGCDAWVLKANSQLPENYAQGRIRERDQEGGLAGQTDFGQWMEYYRRRDVTRIHGGMIALRRRAGANWVHFEDVTETVSGPFGEYVFAGFARHELRQAPDATLRTMRLRLAEQVRLEQQSRVVDGQWRPETAQLRLAGGLPQVLGLEGDWAALLTQFDGRHPVDAVSAELAAVLGLPLMQVQSELLAAVRRLVERGFLEPSDG